MNLKEELQRCADALGLEITDIEIDKDADYRGRRGTAVAFSINHEYRFECVITNDLELGNISKAELIMRNAFHQYNNLKNSVEVEVE